VKTTGGKGLHVIVPIERRLAGRALRNAASWLADEVERRRPGTVTTAFKKADRGGRVMIDPSRNMPGATFIAPYSPRARPDATVSFPVAREELRDVAPTDFMLASVPTLLGGRGPSAWTALASVRQRLPSSLVTE
jgi:DNA primase